MDPLGTRGRTWSDWIRTALSCLAISLFWIDGGGRVGAYVVNKWKYGVHVLKARIREEISYVDDQAIVDTYSYPDGSAWLGVSDDNITISYRSYHREASSLPLSLRECDTRRLMEWVCEVHRYILPVFHMLRFYINTMSCDIAFSESITVCLDARSDPVSVYVRSCNRKYDDHNYREILWCRLVEVTSLFEGSHDGNVVWCHGHR